MAIKRMMKRPEQNQSEINDNEVIKLSPKEKENQVELGETKGATNANNDVSDTTETNGELKLSNASSIVGYDKNNLKGKKQKSPVRKEINVDAKVAKVIFAIGDIVKREEEFITSPINAILKTQGFSNGDISGQFYAMKQNGTLANRPTQTEEEITAFGKGARIWSTTEIFWSRYEKLVVAKEKATKINGDGETIEE